MADNLERRNGAVSFVEGGTARSLAWHGLGTVFGKERPMTVQEAIKACNADYEVKMHPLAVLDDEVLKAIEESRDIPADMLLPRIVQNMRATLRQDTQETLGVVSKSYGLVQNIDAFKFVDTLCSGGDGTPVIESAGVLGRGEKVFITAKFPEPIVLNSKRDDLLDMYVVFTTSHNGLGSVWCVVTPIRVVCNNTLQLALKNNIGRISFKHTANVMKRIDLVNEENAEWAYKTLGIYETYRNGLIQAYEHLRDIRVSERQLDEILAQLAFSDQKAVEAFEGTHDLDHELIKTRGRNIFLGLKESVECGIGQDIIEAGSGQWVINGITTYYQNAAMYLNDESKFLSMMEGRVYNKVNKAYQLVTQL